MDFGLEQSGLPLDLPSGLLNQILFYLVVILITAVIIAFIVMLVKRIFHSSKLIPYNYRKKIFILTVPQRQSDSDENKKDIKEILSGIENFYANLGGMRAQRGFSAWLYGRHDTWSFEVVVGLDGLITFYIAIPLYLVEHVNQQLLSQYPHLQIEEVDDYNIFGPMGVASAGYLKLTKDKMLPILTYKHMDIDPLVSILSSLSKLPEGQTAAIQFIMRSAKGSWRNKGVKVASEMHKGKSFKQALAAVGGGGNILGKPSDWFFTSKNNDKMPTEVYKSSPMEEEMIKLIGEKAAKAGLDVNIRIISFSQSELQSKEIIKQVANAFAQYSSYENANSFKAVIKGSVNKIIENFIYRNYDEKNGFVLGTEEIASLWHMPLSGTEVPKIRWLMARRLPPPVNLPPEGLILGENIYRGKSTPVHIKDADRRRHMYIVGMTGTGKSWFQANLAVQDIQNGHGVCVIDPHGSLIEDILPHIPKDRLDDVIIFDPSDIGRPLGLNMLEASTQQEMDFAASEMITIFYKLLPDPAMAGPMFEHYMRNALLALMADQSNPGTLVELARLFTDKVFRAEKLTHVTDIMVKDFWEREYEASQKGSTGADMLSYVISKTGRFVENEMMRNIIGQSKSGINFRQVMDEKKILLVNLSKGKVGETNSNLLGLIAVAKLQMAALARADMPEEQRTDFYLYIDEFQNFITDSISVILAEARKYKLNLIIGHQYINQLTQGGDSRVKDAVFGNVGNIVCFRIGVDDSEVMAKQLAPDVNEYDLLNVEKFNAYVRILIDNTATSTFNMHCFPLPEGGNSEMISALKQLSRVKYGQEKMMVERDILTRSKIGQLGVKPSNPFFDQEKKT
ncbi:MAG: type IV secretion system DNA-binding domain-containing protein [Candidatus Buchananbacteria bacterium]|nr:type IV secretion system DNA-binding domain-containing protein [Candidatus Buchananbacteria bacterium]